MLRDENRAWQAYFVPGTDVLRNRLGITDWGDDFVSRKITARTGESPSPRSTASAALESTKNPDKCAFP